MEYNERKIGGYIQIVWAAIQMAQVLFTPGSPEVSAELYADENIQTIAQVGEISNDLAISVAAGYFYSKTQNMKPTKDDVKNSAAELVNEHKDNTEDLKKIINEIKTEMSKKGVNPNVPLTEQKSLIQNMAAQTKDVETIQESAHKMGFKAQEDVHTAAKSSFGFLTDMIAAAAVAPYTLAQKGYATVTGKKPEEEQRAIDRKKWEELGYKPEQINQALRIKAAYPNMTDAQIIQSMQQRRRPRQQIKQEQVSQALRAAQPVAKPIRMIPQQQQGQRVAIINGAGEISGLQIAKLVLLVLIIIIVFASAYTGSKMLLGFLPFLLLGLGGMFLYDYLKSETPPKK